MVRIRRAAATFVLTCMLLPTIPVSAQDRPVIILKLSFSRLVVGKSVVQSPATLKTNLNAAADISSVTPTICTVKPGAKGPIVTGLMPGTCRLKAYAMGMTGKFPSATKYFAVPVVAP